MNKNKIFWINGSIYFLMILAMIMLSVFLSVEIKANNELRSIVPETPFEDLSYYDKKVKTFEMENENFSKGQIVFLGDSVTDYCPLNDYYSSLSLATYNRGISGDDTQGVVGRLQTSVYDLNPSKIVIMIGENDIDRQIEEYKILGNYSSILTDIKANLPDCEVYVMSILTQRQEPDMEKTVEKVLKINESLKALAEEFDFTYLNLQELTVDSNNFLLESVSCDGSHLNENGFTIWSNLLIPYLQN